MIKDVLMQALDVILLEMMGQTGRPVLDKNEQTEGKANEDPERFDQLLEVGGFAAVQDDDVIEIPGPSSKGKGRARSRSSTLSSTEEQEQPALSAFYLRATTEEIQSCLVPGQAFQSKCGICFDAFTLSPNPRLASQMHSTKSSSASFGMCLPCPGMHNFCLECISEYVRITITGLAPFPVRCPECPRDCDWEIDDETAGVVLDYESIERWHRQKLLTGPGMVRKPVECHSCLTDSDLDLLPKPVMLRARRIARGSG